jgi:hypothetical protein
MGVILVCAVGFFIWWKIFAILQIKNKKLEKICCHKFPSFVGEKKSSENERKKNPKKIAKNRHN